MARASKNIANTAVIKPKQAIRQRKWLRRLVIMGLIPLGIYFVFFAFYTWPWLSHFNHFFMTDGGDGMQNVWNVWWIHKSVTELHQLPWYTTYLHYPYGVTLLGQTLNPFNGFVALPLLHFMQLNQAFNIMVIFSFLFGGLTMFWLCYYFTKAYVPSIIGGFIFTFSSYHFAHAIGHMQLVSLEWIPLFVLLWWKLLTKPRYRTAIAAAIVLLFVLFCDYYYFLYCVSLAGLILLYLGFRKELPPIKKPQTYRPWIVFILLTFLIVAPLPIALFLKNSRDELQGGHDARVFSTDLFSTIIDGGFWKFASLTHWYWKNIKAYIAESSVYFGLSVITLLVIGLWKRTKIHKDMWFWLGVGALFLVLSMGPRLMVNGYSINHAPLPYAILERLIPQLKLSGDPNRFVAVSFLAAGVISAMVLAKLKLNTRRGQLLLAIFCVVLFVEYWPNKLPYSPVTQPKYVAALKALPATGGVLDDGALSESQQLYHQIGFNKPMILGYISRVPLSTQTKDMALVESIKKTNYHSLCSQYKVRYYTVPASRPLQLSYPVVYRDDQTIIYDLKDSPNC